MNTPWHFNWLQLVSFVTLCVYLGTVRMQAGETDSPNGGSADGIYATVQYRTNSPESDPDLVSIFVHFTPPSTNVMISPFGKIITNTNEIVHLIYFMATNSFCGFVELRNSAGNTIPLLKPELNSPQAYPASYNLRSVSGVLATLVGRGPPLPRVLGGDNAMLSCFHPDDYFKLEKPGRYNLTVWPKIYKRISPTNDICRRIDLPPVSAVIQWSGKKQR